MEDGRIEDFQITASSVQQGAYHGPNNARLNKEQDSSGIGGWCPVTKVNEWIQVNFTINTLVTGVITQGRSVIEQRVTRFKVLYSEDGSNWYAVRTNITLSDEEEVRYFNHLESINSLAGYKDSLEK